MRLITGDELGILKEIIPELCRPPPTDPSGLPLSNPPSWITTAHKRPRPSATTIQSLANSIGSTGQQSDGAVNRLLQDDNEEMTRHRGVIALSFVNSNTATDVVNDGGGFQFAALRMNGTIEKWSANREEVATNSPQVMQKKNDNEGNVTPARYNLISCTEDVFPSREADATMAAEDAVGKGWYVNPPVRPIGMVSTTVGNKQMLTAADSCGNISILDSSSCQVLSRYHAYNHEKEGAVLTYTKGGFANNHVATCLAVNGDRLAVGGRERGVRVLDLETGKGIWKAKNMPPDPQTLLQQPMWTTALQFIHSPHNYSNGTTNNDQSNSQLNLLASGTAYKQVQIYDVRTSSSSNDSTRRPVLHTPQDLLQHRITSLLQLPNPNHLIVADAIGDCHILDLRKFHTGKQSSYKKQKAHSATQEIGLGRLVGPGGSIRQLALHPSLPMVACVGLDRKLWTWDIQTKRMVDCVYLRQRLNCLLICEDGGWNGGGLEEDGDERMVREDGDWEEDEGDEVEDYVDSDEEEEAVSGDEIDESSGSEVTESESEEESSSDDEDEDVQLAKKSKLARLN